ncbi:MAG: glutamine--fructose-6-phosphate transaminase (isomerizing) [Oscillospiraceae bacterium]|nr:glutamine--fructose-6-phosphate transaminase (isomerizing) [Oscillospiraceae bacterium]
MCGIVGYVGNRKSSEILLNGLSRLEYRGYDSAGIATMERNKIACIKTKGKVKSLIDLEKENSLNGAIGIAHTRWATHGKPSTENSHPHLDNSKKFAVVHNGIIENYKELKSFLQKNGYTFYSQTDTEIIPNLIAYYYKKMTPRFLEAVQLACNDLIGSFAIAVLSTYEPNKIIAVRKDSPLVIGKSNFETYICSDVLGILAYTKDFYILNDYEYAEISKDEIKFFNKTLQPIEKEIKSIEWDFSTAEKNGYDDFMLKEIYEQPISIRETIGSKLPIDAPSNLDEITFTRKYLSSLNKIFIIGCGTAMHAGLVAKAMFENLCNIPVEVDIASEFRYRNPIINEKTLAIFISQSGETADTIAALKLAKSKGAKTLAICNVIESTITREADYTIYTHAGPEIAVASTKAYTSQLILLAIIAIHFAEVLKSTDTETLNTFKNDILSISNKVSEILENIDILKEFAQDNCNIEHAFFIGRRMDYLVSLEGSLKLKEITYIHSEGYAAGELKHGPIALIENGINVITIITDQELMDKTLSNVHEVISRGARIFAITNLNFPHNDFDYFLNIPKTNELLSPILSVIPLQLISYYIAKEKGLDVDKPRNLAKSVTVE